MDSPRNIKNRIKMTDQPKKNKRYIMVGNRIKNNQIVNIEIWHELSWDKN